MPCAEGVLAGTGPPAPALKSERGWAQVVNVSKRYVVAAAAVLNRDAFVKIHKTKCYYIVLLVISDQNKYVLLLSENARIPT